MLRTILVGLDGSKHSDAAVELGIRWSKRFGCLLVGIGVIDEPGIRRPEPVPLGGASFKHNADESQMRQARVRVEQFLERFALRCSQSNVPCKLLEDVGLPWERIALEAQRYDLIMLAREANFRFDRESAQRETLERLLKHAPRPVVTVPDGHGGGTSAVIAYDGSLQSARALQAFAMSGLGALGPIHVVTSFEDAVEAAKVAQRAVEFLDAHGLKATRHVAASNQRPSDAILQQAHDLDAHLIVMGVHGRRTLAEFFFGSTTKRVLETSRRPLFLCH